MAYLTATGELVPLGHALGGLGGATAAASGCGLYALRGSEALYIALTISPPEGQGGATRVAADVRVIATLPQAPRTTTLNENCAGTLLSIGLEGGAAGTVPAIFTIDIATGALTEVCRAANSVPSGIPNTSSGATPTPIFSAMPAKSPG